MYMFKGEGGGEGIGDLFVIPFCYIASRPHPCAVLVLGTSPNQGGDPIAALIRAVPRLCNNYFPVVNEHKHTLTGSL